jgi:hypothetical protein
MDGTATFAFCGSMTYRSPETGCASPDIPESVTGPIWLKALPWNCFGRTWWTENFVRSGRPPVRFRSGCVGSRIRRMRQIKFETHRRIEFHSLEVRSKGKLRTSATRGSRPKARSGGGRRCSLSKELGHIARRCTRRAESRDRALSDPGASDDMGYYGDTVWDTMAVERRP